MSQKIVYECLKELGGKATSREIKEYIMSKYPTISLPSYVHMQLKQLKKWGYIKSIIRKDGKAEYEIIKELDLDKKK